MAFDDPIVWVLIIAVVVFLFGANKIPQLAKRSAELKRIRLSIEGDKESFSMTPQDVAPQQAGAFGYAPAAAAVVPPTVNSAIPSNDPLVQAAQKEGIDTTGKTRDQIATETRTWKLKSK